MTRYATVDVGSNSVLIHVAERQPDGAWRVVADRAELTALGEGLRATGSFSEPAMERTAAALVEFVRLARSHGVDQIAAVGTMALRTAANTPEFLARVLAEAGLTVEVIPGEEEARLSFLALTSGLERGAGRVAAFDVGGGSTEFIFGDRERIELRYSLDVGALRLTEEHLRSDPVTPDELDALERALAGELSGIRTLPFDTLVGMGGAITNMTAVMHGLERYDPDRVQGSVLTRGEMARQVELYRSLTVAERRGIVGLQPKRAPTILAGAAIVSAVMRHLDMDEVTVSDRGIRHGLMADRFGQHPR